MTLAEFERGALSYLTVARRANRSALDARDSLRPLFLRLLAGERARIIAALPGGDICDPQEIADMIRTMGDQT
jgi:hypothetical protein